MRTVVLKMNFFSIVQEIIEKSHNEFHWGLLIKTRENIINMVLNKVESCSEA